MTKTGHINVKNGGAVCKRANRIEAEIKRKATERTINEEIVLNEIIMLAGTITSLASRVEKYSLDWIPNEWGTDACIDYLLAMQGVLLIGHMCGLRKVTYIIEEEMDVIRNSITESMENGANAARIFMSKCESMEEINDNRRRIEGKG